MGSGRNKAAGGHKAGFGVARGLLLALLAGCQARVSLLEPLREPVPCVCGDPVREITGCPYWKCALGAGETDNVDCACYPLFAEMSGEPAERELADPLRLAYRSAAAAGLELDAPAGARAAAELAAARAAGAAGLFGRARLHVGRALGLDAACVERAVKLFAELRTSAAETLLARAVGGGGAGGERGNVSAALALAADLAVEFPNEAAAERARQLLAGDLGAAFADSQAELWRLLAEAAPRSDAAGQDAGAARAVEAARAHEALSRAAWLDGLARARSASEAEHAFERALAYGGYALRNLVTWREANVQAAAGSEGAALRALEALATGAIVRASRSLALLALREGSPQSALRALEPALALAPSAVEVRALGHRIEADVEGRGYGPWSLEGVYVQARRRMRFLAIQTK